MNLTTEQKNAVQCISNLMLTACPGSGKTRVIISKLLRILDDLRESPRSVACITYTNTAVYEIESRIRQFIQPGDDSNYEICTIHSFCLNFIFRPFCYLVDGYTKGFKVITPENKEFNEIVNSIWAQQGRYNLTYRDYEDFTPITY